MKVASLYHMSLQDIRSVKIQDSQENSQTVRIADKPTSNPTLYGNRAFKGQAYRHHPRDS